MTMLWTPPTPSGSDQAARRPLWSMGRTAVAVLAAVIVGAFTAVGVSYADTGSSSTTGPRGSGGAGGGFRNPGFGTGGFGAGGFPGGLPGQLGGGAQGSRPQPASASST
jgi:hypothetical protein